MPNMTAPSYDASGFIVLAIGRRALFTDVAPDTLLLLAHEESDESDPRIAEHVHEIGAMAVIA